MEVQLEPSKIHIPCLFYSSKVGVRTCWKSEKSGYPKFRRLSISFQCKVIDLFPNQALSVRLPGLRERSAGMQPPAAPGHYESAPGGPRMFLADLKGHCNMRKPKKKHPGVNYTNSMGVCFFPNIWEAETRVECRAFPTSRQFKPHQAVLDNLPPTPTKPCLPCFWEMSPDAIERVFLPRVFVPMFGDLINRNGGKPNIYGDSILFGYITNN